MNLLAQIEPAETAAVVQSVSYSQDEILANIEMLHCPDGFDADLTFGNGGFYKNRKRPEHCFDIEPLHDGVIRASSDRLPLDDRSIGSAVFDPPFITYVKNGRQHKDGATVMASRFGGYYAYDDLRKHYVGTLLECARVMRKGGVLVFKCQDIVHNHKLHATHCNVIEWGRMAGFRLKDLFVLAAKHRLPAPQKGQQRHARIFHSYFVVLELTA